MKAIRISEFGGPDVMQIKSVDLPVVSAKKILVKVFSAGVNHVDINVREGTFPFLPELPFSPGKEGAGIIEAVGEDIQDFKVGQRVFLCKKKMNSHGTYAEYSLADLDEVYPLDKNLTFDQGAALGVSYFAAYRALVLKAKCAAGETVLIHGASGAVGLATVQLAKHCGLKVIGTAGNPEGLTLVKSNGADYALCHKEKKYLEKLMEITDNKGVNIVIEMLADVNLEKDLSVMAPKGRVAIVGCRDATKIDPRKMIGSEIEVFGVALRCTSPEEWQQMAKGILNGIKDGWVNPIVGKTYALEDAPQAHKDISNSSGAKGKLVISVAN